MNALSIQRLSARYGSGSRSVTAVDDVSLDLTEGAVIGLVGESGSGKSTLAKAVLGLVPVTGGRVLLREQDITGNSREVRALRRRVQLVFQDPTSSLDPRMTIGESLGEALIAHGAMSRSEREAEVVRLLELVALDPAVRSALPRQLSGGQLQRIAIARALGAHPHVLIADEITSSLDVSVQGSILNMMRELQANLGFAMLFISHNLAVVRYLCDLIAVMYLGRIVEIAPAQRLVTAPQHPYTKILLEAIPGRSSISGNSGRLVDADPPDPNEPPPGCRFHPRCPVGPEVIRSRSVCRTDDPSSNAEARVHSAACHYVPLMSESEIPCQAGGSVQEC